MVCVETQRSVQTESSLVVGIDIQEGHVIPTLLHERKTLQHQGAAEA